MYVSSHRRLETAALLIVCILLGGYLYHTTAGAAPPLWLDMTPTEQRTIAADQRRITPTRYRAVTLNEDGLHELLAAAPHERTNADGVVLPLPLPNGRTADFHVSQTDLLAAELAAEFPQIRAYTAVQVGNPAVTARLDWTPHGFHAMILDPAGTVYIDPLVPGDTAHYQSYRRRDFSPLPENLPAAPDVVLDNPAHQPPSSPRAPAVTHGDTLRTYRLAVAATGEYTQYHGGTIADGLSAIVTAINRVTGIYERDIAVRFQLIADNDQIIYTDGSTDPYSNSTGGTMLSQNQSNLDAVIGSANYDIGHVFSTGGGGIATLGVVCSNSAKARGVTGLSNPIGDPFYVDYVSHEIGHQFNALHSFNDCGGGSGTFPYEPGSGSTIMAYAGICGSDDLQSNSDDYFHRISLDEMLAFVTTGNGSTCGTTTVTGNTPPTADAGPNFTIPADTPFVLTGSGSDPDGTAALTYNWEQFDLGTAVTLDDPTNPPYFRSWPATTTPTRTLPRLTDLINNTTAVGEVLPTIADTLTFRLTVRDNQSGGGGTDDDTMTVDTLDTAGPFRVLTPTTAVNWTAESAVTVGWDVAGTTAAPINCAQVDISLSTDGGLTYPHLLATGTVNDGSYTVTVPDIVTTAGRVRVACSDNIFFDISDVNLTVSCPAPSTAPAVTSAVSGADISLTWPPIGADQVAIHHTTTPYFTPTPGAQQAIETDGDYLHTGAVGNGPFYYYALPANVCGTATAEGPLSNHVGAFPVAVTSGD